MSSTEERTRTTEEPAKPTGIVARVARWSAAHRRTVLITWVALLLGALAISGAVGTSYSNNFSLPGTDSQRATDLLQREFPAQAGDEDTVVLHARQGQVTDPAIRARVEPVLQRIERLPHVTGVTSPFERAGAQAISRDGKIAFATVTFDKRADNLDKADIKRVISTAESARSPQLQVELGGQAVAQVQQVSLGFVTVIGLAAAIVILLITFGSALSMSLPIVTALFGLGTGVGLVGVGTHVIDMPDFSTELATMIGLGVGIDYALFIVTRFRENHSKGADVQTATIAAMDTAGRAVLFAGITVIIALLGMFALGVNFL
jgi:putative drug exporter of the RND superfamily